MRNKTDKAGIINYLLDNSGESIKSRLKKEIPSISTNTTIELIINAELKFYCQEQ